MGTNRILATGAAMLVALSPLASAQVTVATPWVRAAVPGQLSTGAFMDVTSARNATIVKVDSPVAGVAEMHTMEKSGDMMKMRAVEKVELPAGKAVRLAPGGFHIMLMDLKKPVKNGETVPITLSVEYADGKKETVAVSAPVRGLGTSPEAQHQHH